MSNILITFEPNESLISAHISFPVPNIVCNKYLKHGYFINYLTQLLKTLKPDDKLVFLPPTPSPKNTFHPNTVSKSNLLRYSIEIFAFI